MERMAESEYFIGDKDNALKTQFDVEDKAVEDSESW